MLHQIGVGALGPVFRTYEPTRDRLVAVKVFRLDVTPEQATALSDELGRVAEGNLFHPSIVEPLSAGVEGTVAYRAEEYVAAESLDVAMRHYAPATMEKVLPFITQLASAIDFARQAGVGHGALHPRDIFVTPDEARATGFGVVDALDRLGLRAPVRRPYSPPERIAGERWGTPADVFSLGAIAFELITGRRPLGLGEQIGPLSGMTLGDRGDAVRAVLVRAMREHPVERYPTAMEFASELERAAGQIVPTKVQAPAPPKVEGPASSEIDLPTAPPIEEPPTRVDEVDPAEATVSETVAAQQESLDLPTLEDSPREVARKVIAAREVRKRQGQSKAKAHGRQDSDAAVSLLVPPDPIPDLGSETVDTVEPTTPFAAKSPSVQVSGLEPPDDPNDLTVPLDVTDEPEPVTPEPPDTPEKVETKLEIKEDLDEFRPREREIDTFRAERAWPRPAQRTDQAADLSALELPTPRAADRPLELPIERAVLPKPTALEPFDPELPPPLPLRPTAPPPPDPAEQHDESAPTDRPRTMMLPTAVGLILGLLGGYLAGYAVGSRDRNTQLAQTTQATNVQPSTSGPGPSPTPPRAETRPPNSAPTSSTTTPSEPSASATRGQAASATAPTDGGRATAAPASEAKRVEPPASATQKPTATEQRRSEAAPPVPKESSRAAAKPPAASTATAKPPAVTPPVTVRETRKPEAAAVAAGRIVVSSTPSRAAVTVNGVWSGRTPLTLADRPFGNYVVRVVEPGYEVARQEFVLSSSAPAKTIDVMLEPVGGNRGAKPTSKPQAAAPAVPVESKPAPTAGREQSTASVGAIFVDSRPQGARVIVDGKTYGVTPITVPGLTVGQHTIRLELADHAPWTKTETVTAGTTSRVTGSLEPIQ